MKAVLSITLLLIATSVSARTDFPCYEECEPLPGWILACFVAVGLGCAIELVRMHRKR